MRVSITIERIVCSTPTRLSKIYASYSIDRTTVATTQQMQTLFKDLLLGDTGTCFYHRNDKCCKVTDSFMINMKWRLEQYNEYRMLIWEK